MNTLRKLLVVGARRVSVIWLLAVLTSPFILVGFSEAPKAEAPKKTQEWDKTIAAAKKEGKVTIYGPPGAKIRKIFVDDFQKEFGIPVEFIGVAGGAQIAAKVLSERQAGQYNVDVFVFGATTLWGPLKGALTTFEDKLILPTVKNKNNWGVWRLSDKEGDKVFAFGMGVGPYPARNTTMVSANDFKTHDDLLDPKWQGKIVIADPRIVGQARYAFAAIWDIKGEAFLRKFLTTQKPTLVSSTQLLAEWVARGKFPVGIGTDTSITAPFVAQGLPIAGVFLEDGGHYSPGYSSVAFADKAPHPNAAKVLVNWLLTPKPQEAFSLATDRPSARKDVPTDKLPKGTAPKKGVKYGEPYLESSLPVIKGVDKLFDEIYGK